MKRSGKAGEAYCRCTFLLHLQTVGDLQGVFFSYKNSQLHKLDGTNLLTPDS